MLLTGLLIAYTQPVFFFFYKAQDYLPGDWYDAQMAGPSYIN